MFSSQVAVGGWVFGSGWGGHSSFRREYRDNPAVGRGSDLGRDSHPVVMCDMGPAPTSKVKVDLRTPTFQ